MLLFLLTLGCGHFTKTISETHVCTIYAQITYSVQTFDCVRVQSTMEKTRV